MAEEIRGYLVITVIEASGKNKDENYVWDSSDFDGFVKVELRGGVRNIKASTRKAAVGNTSVLWNESLTLDVLDNSNELRVMLCREKPPTQPGGKRSTSVIAACGIYVSDILDAVPIDKFFELFKPGGGGDGGFIRLGLDYVLDPSQLPKTVSMANGNAVGGAASTGAKKKRRGLWAIPVLLVAAAAGALLGKKVLAERKREEQQRRKP